MTQTDTRLDIFDRRESNVRSYCRAFPAVFRRAQGSLLFDEHGSRYVDFFAGAGALNYGHNNRGMKLALIDYLEQDGITHGLDMATSAKADFLDRFERVILSPRNLDYKVQFVGPTGTNAVEAALKLARRKTGRPGVIAFSNAFHGLTAGALAVTANSFYRNPALTNSSNVCFMPYDGYLGSQINTVDYLRKVIEDPASGVDLPAAVILETVQAEGDITIASDVWLQELAALCRKHDIILIVDDIQVGCGRTGTFFSFERVGIEPDIVLLSKSISGYGLPMSLALLRPELDSWQPGEHTGTFRGNNLAFVTAAEALNYWATEEFSEGIRSRGLLVERRLQEFKELYPELEMRSRGVGLIHGLEFPDELVCRKVAAEAFGNGLVIELCGGHNNTLKILPALTIEKDVLDEGMDIIKHSIATVLQQAAV